MNKNWFTCRVKYPRMDINGNAESVTESFLIDAYSYTEAEGRIVRIMTDEGYTPFQVLNISKNNFAEVIPFDDAEKWFKVKISLVSYDEETQKEKQSNQFIMLSANDVKDAYDRTTEVMKGTLSDFVIPSITFTKIAEVFPITEDERLQNEMAEKGYKPVKEVLENASELSNSMAEFAEAMNSQNIDQETGEILD